MRFLKKIINKINKGTKLIPGVMVLTVLLLSIGYSAFSSNSRISGISGEVRIKKDIRITGVQTLIETSPLCTLKEDTDGNGAVSVGDLYNCNPGDGYKDFYVLEIENEISLIMSENIDDETFNEDAAADAALLEKTTGWTDSRIGSITLPTVEQIVGGDPYSIGFSPKASWLYGNYWTSTYDPIGGTRWRVEGEYIDYFELDGIRPVITVETLDANDGESIYQEYNVNNISAGIRLPSENSSVTFRVRVTNIEAQEMAIANITGLPDNLEYELLNYSFKDKICDASGECNLGISKDILIRVKYKDEGYNSNDTEYNILLNFEFKPIYKVTYTGIDRTVCTLKNDTDGNGVVSVGDLYSCNPGDGDREFYVLETGDNISLIMSENIDNELLTADSINDGAEVDEALLEKTAGWTDSRISSIALPTTEQLTGYDANERGPNELLYSWLEGYYYTLDNESLGGGRWRVEGNYLDYFSSAGIRPVITVSKSDI